MNRKSFIQELENRISYPYEKCLIINEVLEDNFFISKKNKDKIIDDLIQRLSISKVEATKIYDTAVIIVKEEIKNKLKHPFRSQD